MNIIKYENYKINESLEIPGLNINQFLIDVDSCKNSYVNVIASYFKTKVEYIDIVDSKKHIIQINDMDGDILKNNRVVIKTIIFNENDLNLIKKNMIEFSLKEFYSNLPEVVDVFGIKVKPSSFIINENIRNIFDSNINLDMIKEFIYKITGYKFLDKKDDFYIWKK